MPDAIVLFELEQLASYVQADLDEASATLARTLATGLIQAHTAQTLFKAETTDRLERDPFDAARLLLPQLPVDGAEDITTVGVDNGATTDWTRFGQSLVMDSGAWDEQVDVTYTHGFATIPATIQAVALACASRIMVNPGGIRSSAVGDVSTTFAGADDDLVSGAFLTPREQDLLNVFRLRRHMVQVR